MSLIFDTSKKSEKELVLEKRVPLRIQGKNYVYLMTNDFTVISEKLKSFGCRIPNPEDFRENPSLANNVQQKMTELGATWSLVITSELAVLNYFDSNNEFPFIVFLENLTTDGKNSSIIKMFNYVQDNDVEKIKDLVATGYDVDQCIESGTTSLMLACAADACESTKVLIELGADINATDANGQTPLMYTTFNNSVYSVKLLLGCKEIKLEEKDITGSTALLKAAAHRSYEVLDYLIESGADIDAVNYYGESALTHTISQKNWNVSRKLIQYGANVNFSDKMGRTPLIVAAQYDNNIIAEALLKSGADPFVKDINQNTAFLVAAENNSARITKLLIDTQKISDEEYTRAVIKAAMKGNVDVLVVLLENSKNQKEMTIAALTSACLTNNANVVHVCMDFDCDINDSPYFGMSPLMIASYINADKAAAQLIAYDADINKVDENGITALMYAASKNNPNLLMLLIRNGADKTVKDKSGKTFEDYTKSFDNRSFSQLIIERMKLKLPATEINRKDEIPQKHQPFLDRFDWYMQKYLERFPNNKQSDIYKDAGISKQNFSKIISNRKPDFRPKKDTVIQLALGLKLTLNESEDFLQSAGYAFSEMDKKDLEVKTLLNEKNYKLYDWNDRIYGVTGKVFFKALVESEEDE
ncbi:MAG: ankyrin repeat domain-containing protein [Spirochaetaceae bacterium]|nr:ankyrin repeat domain-containing protein [Spirochaetaceae bacterium]